MRIGIIGAGGVGGYFGARLHAGGNDITFVARGPHLAAIQREGLRVITPDEDFTVKVPAHESPADVGEVDVVLVAVKSNDTEQAATLIAPLLGADTVVISLQNGVDNEDQLADAVGMERVLGAVTFILSAIDAPGVIRVSPGPARIVFGELDGRRTGRADAFLETLVGTGIDAELSDNVRGVLWGKLGFICAIAGMTAATRLSLGPIRDSPEAWAMLVRLSQEVCAVARAEGVVLPADITERHVSLARSLDAGATSSLARDLALGNRLELGALHGSVVRKAGAVGVAVPMTEAVYAMLKPWADGKPAR